MNFGLNASDEPKTTTTKKLTKTFRKYSTPFTFFQMLQPGGTFVQIHFFINLLSVPYNVKVKTEY